MSTGNTGIKIGMLDSKVRHYCISLTETEEMLPMPSARRAKKVAPCYLLLNNLSAITA